jgi:signal recognition particle subunit SRP54
MFENLSDKLDLIFKKLRGQGVMTEENIKEALREVRLVLLEADVNFKVVKDFIEKVRERAIGSQVLQSLTPGQQVIKIVHDELVSLMGGGGDNSLDLAAKPPVAIMLVGLQGAGKTTTCGKLARYLKGERRRPLLVPADVYRPAAIEQLKTLGRQLSLEVFDAKADQDPVDICREALKYAGLSGFDTVIFDTAGVRAILDWELTHLGDPVEDLGWLCVRAWRFGNDALPVGGVGTRETLVKAYQEAGGEPVDPEALRFWEVCGNFKLALVFISQCRAWIDGVPSLELASLGRRTAEAEQELLELMEGAP